MRPTKIKFIQQVVPLTGQACSEILLRDSKKGCSADILHPAVGKFVPDSNYVDKL